MCNTPNLDLVKINAYAKIWSDSINSFTQDFEQKVFEIIG